MEHTVSLNGTRIDLSVVTLNLLTNNVRCNKDTTKFTGVVRFEGVHMLEYKANLIKAHELCILRCALHCAFIKCIKPH